jgi:hypothetical protein
LQASIKGVIYQILSREAAAMKEYRRNKNFFHSFLVALAVVTAACGAAASTGSMNEQTRIVVEQGNWGGEAIRLSVNEKSSNLEFACADAAITEALTTDSAGNFKAHGYYHARRPGPERERNDSAETAATFTGKIKANEMFLEIVMDSTGKSVGKFKLEANKNVRLIRCL